MIKVMIVDDHQVLIDGVKALFKNNPEIQISDEANTGTDAILKVAENPTRCHFVRY